MTPSEQEQRLEDLRQKIIGLGESSHRKSYYPQLQGQIDELNRALQALKESEEKYRTLVENVNIGIFRSLPEKPGRFIQVNPALTKILGYPSEEALLLVLPVEIYESPEDRENIIAELKSKGKIKDRKAKLRRRDGTLVMCSLTITSTFDAEGRMEFIDGVIEDITEKELREEALRQANNKLNLLSSVTRHDITNQVMVLEGYLSLAVDHMEDPEGQKLLQKALSGARAIERHIAFTKDYQEIGIHAPQWVDLHESLVAAFSTLDRSVLNIIVEAGDYEVFTDPMIGKVFYNLASNVIKHGKATTLEVYTEVDGGNLTLVFQDNGVGIDDKSKLFRRGTSSSGYGLFLSKEILSITGIGIRENGKPGEGARFEIVFPPILYRVPQVQAVTER